MDRRSFHLLSFGTGADDIVAGEVNIIWERACECLRVTEGETDWSVGTHRRLTKWLIGLLCHKIRGLALGNEQLHNHSEVQLSNRRGKMDNINL